MYQRLSKSLMPADQVNILEEQDMKTAAVLYRSNIYHMLTEEILTLHQLNETLNLLEELRDMENKIDDVYRPIEDIYTSLRYSQGFLFAFGRCYSLCW